MELTRYSLFLIFLWVLSSTRLSEGAHGGACFLGFCDAPFNCTGGICLCPGETTTAPRTIWDPSAQSCFFLASPSVTGCVVNPAPNQVPCIPTANCLRVGGVTRCVCQGDLTPNDDGKCVWNAGYRPCSRKKDLCDPLKFLQCGQTYECECGDGRMFNVADDICQILPGSECSSTEGPTCLEPSTCTGTTCTCPGSSTPKADLCVLKYDETCVIPTAPNSVQCDPESHLECDPLVLKCRCPEESLGKSVWDEISRTCFLQPNTECSLDKNTHPQCIPTSTCLKFNDTAVCTCRNGLKPNVQNMCRIEVGANCNRDNDLCDPLQYLQCTQEGICGCRKGSVYDIATNKCRILPGEDCDPINGDEVCLSPSSCSFITDPSVYKCICPSPSFPSFNDPTLCVLKRLDSCSSTGDAPICDPFENFICDPNNNTCLCRGESAGITFWNSEASTCFIYPGQPCKLNGVEIQCTPTASCTLADDASSSYCECKEPMEISTNRQCHLNLGDKCSTSIDLCDPEQFLSCSLEGKCYCGEGGLYDSSKGKCIMLPNFPCSVQECVPSAFCNTTGDPPLCTCPYPAHPSAKDPSLCVLDLYEYCNPLSSVCDPGEYLKCSGVSGTCECDLDPADPNDPVYFDPPTKTCFLKANSTCTKKGQKCTPNSSCLEIDGQLICKCREGFIRNKFGRCYLPKGSPCLEENDLCDPAAYLQCNQDNICGCDGSVSIDDECKANPGTPCNDTGGGGIGIPQPCVPNAGCVDGQCQCLGDLVPNKEGQCVLKHSQICYSSEDGEVNDLCDPLGPLNCTRELGMPMQICLCVGEVEGRTYYSRSADTCFLKVGEECGTPESLPMPCIPNAICDPYKKICTCSEPELIPNSNGFCYLPYGAPCESQRDRCDPSSYLECNGDPTGTCECQRQFETVYEARTGQCVLIHDRPCDRDGGQPCDFNADCTAPRPGNHTYRCRCKENYFPNAEKLCFLQHGGECREDTDCDLWGHVKCLGGKCECPEMSKWNGEECVVLVGGYCGGAEGGKRGSGVPGINFKCVDGAECRGIQGICMCKDGLEPVGDNSQCLPSYGSECCPGGDGDRCRCKEEDNLVCVGGKCECKGGYYEYGLPEVDEELRERTVCLPGFNLSCEVPPGSISPGVVCNPSTFLECRDGVCQCPDKYTQTYLEAVKQCRVYVGRRCDNDTKICVPRAVCSETGICLCGEDSKPIDDLCFPKTSSATLNEVLSYLCILLISFCCSKIL